MTELHNTESQQIDALLQELRDEQSAAPPEDTVEQDTPAAAAEDGEGPADEPTTQEEDDGVEPQEAETIDAPQFWKAEQKELFKTLDPEAQRVILERETERDAEHRRNSQEAVAKARAAEEKERKLAEKEQGYATRIDAYLANLGSHDPIMDEWNRMDHVREARENPADYVAKEAAFKQHCQKVNALIDERKRLAKEAYDKQAQEAHRVLTDRLPEWRDDAKRTELTSSVGDTMVKVFGLSREDLERTADPRHFLIMKAAHDFLKLESAKKTAEAKRTSAPPKVVKPSSQANSKIGPEARVKSLHTKAKNTGRTEDFATALLAELRR